MLEEIKTAFAAGDYLITGSVRKVLARNSWDESDVKACVSALTKADFYKSKPATNRPGEWVDVYKPVYGEIPMYLKYTIDEDGRTIVMLSFYEDSQIH